MAASSAAPGASAAEEQCRIVVEDNGIGFEEKHRERIFGVFQRLHPRDVFEGTGIGLALCRKIVERHGGQITAHSTPGHGSAFEVLVAGGPSQNGNDRRDVSNSHNSRTILMADDDGEDCVLVGDALRETGRPYDLRFVRNGEELFDYLRRQGEYADRRSAPLPDLILLDLKMPRKDGRETLRELKSRSAVAAHSRHRLDHLDGRATT